MFFQIHFDFLQFYTRRFRLLLTIYEQLLQEKDKNFFQFKFLAVNENTIIRIICIRENNFSANLTAVNYQYHNKPPLLHSHHIIIKQRNFEYIRAYADTITRHKLT